MGNQNGRPPALAPRVHSVRVRLNEAEKQRLEEAAALLETTKTEVIAKGIDRIHAEAVARASRQK